VLQLAQPLDLQQRQSLADQQQILQKEFAAL